MILCCFGFSKQFIQEKITWLEEDVQRRLVFVDDAVSQVDHPQVKTYLLESPLQIHSIATRIAEDAVLFPLEIINKSDSPLFPNFQETLLEKHRLASLLLSDAADFGCSVAQNAKQNLSKPFRLIQDLKGAFDGIPAILVGAGPSLEKDAPHIASFQNKALIFAGGHGLEKIPCKPHFGAILDKNPLPFSPKHPEIPLFFQARAHPISWEGERILAPESHFSFLNFLSQDFSSFDSGWTVGNFMAQLATFLGCNPIICSGMDYCYSGNKKYAFDVSESEEDQPDWAAAVSWMKDLAAKNPEVEFLKTSGGHSYFPECELTELQLKEMPNLKIGQALSKTRIHEPISFSPWKEALQRKEDSIYEELLLPLWKLWRPVFAREYKPSESEEKMEIHKKLFFEQVLQEHLNAIN